MATTIKQISVYNGSAWETANIGVNASDVTLSSNIAGSTNLQTALNNILPASQLAASKIVLTDANKKLTTSTVSTTELGYLSGTTASIQTQLNGKVSKTGDTMTGDLTINKTGPQTFYTSTNVNSAVGKTIPSSGETQQGGLQFTDSQGYNTGWVRQYKDASDNTYIQNVIRRKVNSSDITNSLTLGISSSGSRYVSVPDGSIWRTAIGAQASGNYTTFNNSNFSATSLSANYSSNQEIQLAVTSKTSGKNRIFIMGDNGVSMYNSSTNAGVWSLPISKVVLNDVAHYTTTSLFTGSSYVSVIAVNFYLIGKRLCNLCLQLQVKANMTANTDYVVATLSNTALRPILWSESNGFLGNYTLEHDGKLHFRPGQNLTTAAGNIYSSFTYITNANYPS